MAWRGSEGLPSGRGVVWSSLPAGRRRSQESVASRPFSPIGAKEPKGPSMRQRSKSDVAPWDRRRPAGS